MNSIVIILNYPRYALEVAHSLTFEVFVILICRCVVGTPICPRSADI